jgi:hypothetical protein
MNRPPSPPRTDEVALADSGPAAPPHSFRRRWRPLGGWPWFAGRLAATTQTGASRTPPKPVLALARPRRMKQTGQAVFLWAFAFYAVAQLTLFLALDYEQPVETVYHAKWPELTRLVAREPERPLVVMVGSSRTYRAFQAGQMDGLPDGQGQRIKAYNFGVPAFGALREWMFVRDMFEKGIRPRLLVVEYLPPLLNRPCRGLVSEEKWISAPWLSVSHLVRLSPYLVNPRQKAQEWAAARLAPWFAFRYHLQCDLEMSLRTGGLPPSIELYQDRWGLRYAETWTPEQMVELLRNSQYMYEATLAHLRLGDGPCRAMRDLLDRCQKEKVPVLLVLMPESTVFRSWYKTPGLAEARRLLGQLSETYGARVLDTTELLADEDFSDGHHVHASGAQIFTGRLIEEVQQILAPSRPAGEEAATP